MQGGMIPQKAFLSLEHSIIFPLFPSTPPFPLLSTGGNGDELLKCDVSIFVFSKQFVMGNATALKQSKAFVFLDVGI